MDAQLNKVLTIDGASDDLLLRYEAPLTGAVDTVKVEEAATTFWIMTIIMVIAFFVVFTIIIVLSFKATDLAPLPPITQKVQSNVNPMIRTQEQCLKLPYTVWSDSGCGCQFPYTGEFCMQKVVDGYNYVGDVTSVRTEDSVVTLATDETACSHLCNQELGCQGFIFDGQNCYLLKQDMVAQTDPGGSRNNLYINRRAVSNGNFKFAHRIFVARNKDLIPQNFWNRPATDYFAEVPLDQVVKLDFVPELVIGDNYLVIVAKSNFDPGPMIDLIRSGQMESGESLRFANNSLPNLSGFSQAYIYFTRN